MNTTEWGHFFFLANIASQRSKLYSSLSKHSLNRTLLIEVNIYYLVLCLCKGDTSGLNKNLDVISSSLRKSPGACMYPVSVEKKIIYYHNCCVCYVCGCSFMSACQSMCGGWKKILMNCFFPSSSLWLNLGLWAPETCLYLTISLLPDFFKGENMYYRHTFCTLWDIYLCQVSFSMN